MVSTAASDLKNVKLHYFTVVKGSSKCILRNKARDGNMFANQIT